MEYEALAELVGVEKRVGRFPKLWKDVPWLINDCIRDPGLDRA